PSLVNTVALTGLLRRVGLSLSSLSLENVLAVCEERVHLDAVTGLCLLFFGFFFLSHDSDSENLVCEFRCELSSQTSLSDAWVTGRDSSNYPVGNRVVAVRNVDVLPRTVAVRAPCSRVRIILPVEQSMLGRLESFRVLGLVPLLIVRPG
ncbi:hypothetical protein Tco_1323613, partial [Tanacetum coccineum]